MSHEPGVVLLGSMELWRSERGTLFRVRGELVHLWAGVASSLARRTGEQSSGLGAGAGGRREGGGGAGHGEGVLGSPLLHVAALRLLQQTLQSWFLDQ